MLNVKRRASYLSLVRQVCFVANKHDDYVTASLCSHIINPLGSLVEGVSICFNKI